MNLPFMIALCNLQHSGNSSSSKKSYTLANHFIFTTFQRKTCSPKAFNWMNSWLRYVICNTQETVIPPILLRFTTHSFNFYYITCKIIIKWKNGFAQYKSNYIFKNYINLKNVLKLVQRKYSFANAKYSVKNLHTFYVE